MLQLLCLVILNVSWLLLLLLLFIISSSINISLFVSGIPYPAGAAEVKAMQVFIMDMGGALRLLVRTIGFSVMVVMISSSSRSRSRSRSRSISVISIMSMIIIIIVINACKPFCRISERDKCMSSSWTCTYSA